MPVRVPLSPSPCPPPSVLPSSHYHPSDLTLQLYLAVELLDSRTDAVANNGGSKKTPVGVNFSFQPVCRADQSYLPLLNL